MAGLIKSTPASKVFPYEQLKIRQDPVATLCKLLSLTGRLIERLVMKRDERRDGFAKSIQRAMDTTPGSDAEETTKALAGRSIPTKMVKEAVESVARDSGRFTVFRLVDALTRATRDTRYAGDRIEQDARIGALLSLAV